LHIKQSKTWLKCPVRVTSTHMDVPLTICSPSDDLACILQYNAVLQLDTDVFTFLQHCCYVVVCRFVRSLMAFVCQEIKGLLTYLMVNYCQLNCLCGVKLNSVSLPNYDATTSRLSRYILAV